jgi:hypothetical protein
MQFSETVCGNLTNCILTGDWRIETDMDEMNIKIKDERMLRRIADLARAHNRSPEVEALELLAAGLRMAAPYDRVKEAQRIAAMTPKEVVQTDGTLLIREDREDPDR